MEEGFDVVFLTVGVASLVAEALSIVQRDGCVVFPGALWKSGAVWAVWHRRAGCVLCGQPDVQRRGHSDRHRADRFRGGRGRGHGDARIATRASAAGFRDGGKQSRRGQSRWSSIKRSQPGAGHLIHSAQLRDAAQSARHPSARYLSATRFLALRTPAFHQLSTP